MAVEAVTRAEAVAPTVDEILDRARALRPLLDRNATNAERLRRVPDENIEAMREAGLFRLCTPRRFGGFEAPLQLRTDVYEILGGACGGTGWVASICDEMARIAGCFGDQAQEEFFGDNPDAIFVASFAPNFAINPRRVEGGVTISAGRFGFASGCWHADWCAIQIPLVHENGEVAEPGPDGIVWAWIPESDFTIEETWDCVGMSGSGTHTVVVERDITIPDHRMIKSSMLLMQPQNAPGPLAHPDESTFRISGVVPGLVMTAPILGAARTALELVLELAPRRGINFSPYLSQAESTTFQTQVGDAAMKIETANLHLRRAIADLEHFAVLGLSPDFATSSRVQGEAGYIATQIREAVELLMTAHGAGSFMGSGTLQRLWRDVNTAGRHAFLNSGLCRETYGKSLLKKHTVGPLPQAPDAG